MLKPELVNMEILCFCRLRLLYLVYLLIKSSVSTTELSWTRDATLDNKLSTAGYNLKARSLLQCSRFCSTDNTCVSFFFAPGQELNCQLHDSILMTSAGFQSVPASKYYVQDGASQSTTNTTTVTVPPTTSDSSSMASPFTCHSDDGIFRTVKLDDGNTFTYKVMKVSEKQFLAAKSCEDEGGFLARVTTVAKMSMLLQLTGCPDFNGPDYYLDGSNADAPDWYSSGAWTMSNGDLVPMEKDFWGTSFPNKPATQHCFRMRSDIGYKWDDCSCNDFHYFICEQ